MKPASVPRSLFERAQAQMTGGIKPADVIAADDVRWRALLGGDIAALSQLLCDDFTYTHSTGITDTKEFYLEKIRLGRVKYISEVRRDTNVVIHDMVALLRGHVIFEADVYPGAVRRVIDSVYLGVWIKTLDGLKMATYASTLSPTALARK